MLRGWPGFRPADPPRWQPGPSIPNARHHQYRQRGAHCRGIPAATVWSPEMRRPGAAEQPRTRYFVVVLQWARRGSTLQSEAAAVLQWHQAAGECPRADAGTDRRPRPARPWEPKMRTRHSRYEWHPDLVVRTAPPSPDPVCSGVPRRNSPTQRSPWAPSSTRRTPAVWSQLALAQNPDRVRALPAKAVTRANLGVRFHASRPKPRAYGHCPRLLPAYEP